ncbi:MAG TPA: EamA family transporter [Longimicrobiales bacterium]|nr:EamA family transporter [Longimicrobiales bacterium]
MPVDHMRADPRAISILAAFGAIYVIWGSTYLGIRWAIETMPPLLMASVRFLLAGAILYAWSIWRGAASPAVSEWRGAAVAGGLMLGGGNGAVVVAEQWVPSGLTALLVASVPLWLVVLDALFGSRRPPTRRALVGLFVGFAGVALLGGSPGVGQGGSLEALGAVLLLAGSAAWAAGSIYVRTLPAPSRPLLWVSMQMISGGAILAILTLATGEWIGFRPGGVSLRSALSLAYLVVFGALIGYSAYVWLLRVSTPARVGTYAYVNPVIALLLGWWLAEEPLTFRSMLAASIILGSVVVIVSETRSPPGLGASPGAHPRGG